MSEYWTEQQQEYYRKLFLSGFTRENRLKREMAEMNRQSCAQDRTRHVEFIRNNFSPLSEKEEVAIEKSLQETGGHLLNKKP